MHDSQRVAKPRMVRARVAELSSSKLANIVKALEDCGVYQFSLQIADEDVTMNRISNVTPHLGGGRPFLQPNPSMHEVTISLRVS